MTAVAPDGASLIHFGPVDPKPPADGYYGPPAAGPRDVHVIGRQGIFASVGEWRDTRLFVDSTCKTCRISLSLVSRKTNTSQRNTAIRSTRSSMCCAARYDLVTIRRVRETPLASPPGAIRISKRSGWLLLLDIGATHRNRPSWAKSLNSKVASPAASRRFRHLIDVYELNESGRYPRNRSGSLAVAIAEDGFRHITPTTRTYRSYRLPSRKVHVVVGDFSNRPTRSNRRSRSLGVGVSTVLGVAKRGWSLGGGSVPYTSSQGQRSISRSELESMPPCQ